MSTTVSRAPNRLSALDTHKEVPFYFSPRPGRLFPLLRTRANHPVPPEVVSIRNSGVSSSAFSKSLSVTIGEQWDRRNE